MRLGDAVYGSKSLCDSALKNSEGFVSSVRKRLFVVCFSYAASHTP